MKLDYESNTIYSKWVDDSKKTFSTWKDSDFYSDKAEHIYFYSNVNDETVQSLQSQLQELQKTKKNNNGKNIIYPPKPIVIHLFSPGGSVFSEEIFYSMIMSIRVPLCVIVESLCASAATTLALLAPYRIIVQYSSYLIHDMAGVSWGKEKENEKIQDSFMFLYSGLTKYLSLVETRTLLQKHEIKEFIERDKLVNTEYCLRKKIVDRVLQFPSIKNYSSYSNSSYPDLKLPLSVFIKKTNMNHMYFDTSKLWNYESYKKICKELDNYIVESSEKSIKPLLIHFRPSGFYANPLNSTCINYRIALLQQKVPVIALLEGPQSLQAMSSIVMCPMRIMMSSSIISSHFSESGFGSDGWGWKTIDILYNTKFKFQEIISYFKKHTNLPYKFYKELQYKIINLKPEDLIKYNIVHKVVNFQKTKKISMNNISRYYNMNSLVKNYNTPKTSKSTKPSKSKTSKSKTSKPSKSTKSTKTSKTSKTKTSKSKTKPKKSTK